MAQGNHEGRLAGQVAVITGGASGLGEATARLFVAEGARVVIADLHADLGQPLADELGESALFVQTNVTRESDVAAAVDRAVSHFGGRLDCRFNNAGIIGAVGGIDEIEVEDFDATVAVNLRGVYLGMKHAARIMKPQGSGVILSTSSVAGVIGGLGPHTYATCKAAVIGLTRNVAAELGPFGIRVNAIAPGSMVTPMVAVAFTGDPSKLERAQRGLEQASPLKGRAGQAIDIAHAALWLASQESGYVSGHTLTVDAGITTGSGFPPPTRFLQPGEMVREGGRVGRESA
jgi:NAD(P)-dependent dehydrogenase (short-subunit alcohol dehydrogenase family)